MLSERITPTIHIFLIYLIVLIATMQLIAFASKVV